MATAEHYYQACKFTDPDIVNAIATTPRPGKAKRIANKHSNSHLIRSDWFEIRVDVMKKALMAKFSQHEDLKKLLLGTGDIKLVEGNEHDMY